MQELVHTNDMNLHFTDVWQRLFLYGLNDICFDNAKIFLNNKQVKWKH